MSTVEVFLPKIAKFAPKVIRPRFTLDLGDDCNGDCQFCFQRNFPRNQARMHALRFQEALQCLLQLKANGVEAIELAGGEPTVRPDLPRIVAFARKIGMNQIRVATNGMRLADHSVVRELKNAGVDSFRFMLLGPNAAVHDLHTRIAGSFQQLNLAIQHCQHLGVEVRVNTVVTGLNYNFLESIIEKLYQLQVFQVNFVCIHSPANNQPSQDALNILYSLVAPKFQRIADQYWKVMAKITFSFIPFCFMVGYEQYVNNPLQIIHDTGEADFRIENQSHFAFWHSTLANPVNYSFLASYQNAIHADWQRCLRDVGRKLYELRYRCKSTACADCRYDLICDGIWRNYGKWVGFGEIRPVPGKKIQDPTYFMRSSKR